MKQYLVQRNVRGMLFGNRAGSGFWKHGRHFRIPVRLFYSVSRADIAISNLTSPPLLAHGQLFAGDRGRRTLGAGVVFRGPAITRTEILPVKGIDAAPDRVLRGIANNTAFLPLPAVLEGARFRAFVGAAGVPADASEHGAFFTGEAERRDKDEVEHEKAYSGTCMKVFHFIPPVSAVRIVRTFYRRRGGRREIPEKQFSERLFCLPPPLCDLSHP
jgi:hypothetical protein